MQDITVRIDDRLLRDADAFAAQRGRSLDWAVEEASRQMLGRVGEAGERSEAGFPSCGEKGREPLVDVSPAGLKRIFAEDDIERYKR